MWSNWTIKLIMLIMQITQHMQISIRQFLYTGDPYFTFLQKNFGVLNISGFTMGLYGLATRLYRAYSRDVSISRGATY